jgi:hypothetical protein
MTKLSAFLAVPVCAIVYPIAALAGASDYAFEPVEANVHTGPKSELAVRLVHRPDGKAAGGAVIFRTRVDMSPENMAEHTTSVEAVPSSGDGIYRFKADLSMPGSWALRLMAKVPGEKDSIEGTVIFRAKD